MRFISTIRLRISLAVNGWLVMLSPSTRNSPSKRYLYDYPPEVSGSGQITIALQMQAIVGGKGGQV